MLERARREESDDEDSDSQVQAALRHLQKSAREHDVTHAERYEPIRVALKFLCDLGAHPEVAEAERKHAHASLLMAAGLLKGVGSL